MKLYHKDLSSWAKSLKVGHFVLHRGSPEVVERVEDVSTLWLPPAFLRFRSWLPLRMMNMADTVWMKMTDLLGIEEVVSRIIVLGSGSICSVHRLEDELRCTTWN